MFVRLVRAVDRKAFGLQVQLAKTFSFFTTPEGFSSPNFSNFEIYGSKLCIIPIPPNNLGFQNNWVQTFYYSETPR